ncbi:hypothetical protein ElyMa_003770100 [Elysia marginata]|uniref:Reverse transcriptase domain-containing protein n=1 Tax=Elysia marginata TaxID=1093978 RepID=A0AAV4FA70_9GAST|nr:hypothetical protein ElyMa_003770100 [Elysia marginata]
MAFSSTLEAMATYSNYCVSEQRQRCIECSSERCSLQKIPPSPHSDEFSLTISLKKTNIIGHHVDTIPTIIIEEQILEVVDKFTYLGFTISNKLSLDAELNVRRGKASTTMARLSKRVYGNTILTKMIVYQACVLSTLLYGSESWTLH